MKQFKKILLIDLDGVLNEYTGNFDEKFIPKPKAGVEKFLESLSENFELMLFTTRNKILVAKWLVENKLDKYFTDITDIKKLSYLMVDDRCINFNGNYNELLEKIINFKPWYKN